MCIGHLRAHLFSITTQTKRRSSKNSRHALGFERHPLLEPLEERRLLACQTINATLPCVTFNAVDKTVEEGQVDEQPQPILWVGYHGGAGSDVVPEFEVAIEVLAQYPDDAFGLKAVHGSGAVQYVGDGSRLKMDNTGGWSVFFEAYEDSVNPELPNEVLVRFAPDGTYDIESSHLDGMAIVTITDPNQEQSENEKSCQCTCVCEPQGNNSSQTKAEKNAGANKTQKRGGGAQTLQYASEANPHPIVTVRALHPQLTGPATRVAATLTLTSADGKNFTNTEHFSVAGLSINDPVSYGVQVPIETFGPGPLFEPLDDTGRYRWTMDLTYFDSQDQPVTLPGGGYAVSYSGYKHVVDFAESKFGNRWNHADVDRLYVQSNQFYTGALLVHGNGESDFFTGSGVGTWTREVGERGFSTLQKLSGGNFKLTDKFGNISWFTSAGYLYYREDRNGNITSYAYDAQNRLTQIAQNLAILGDTSGRTTTFAYDVNGYIDYVDDFAGRRTQYTVQQVDGVYKLTSVADPVDGTLGPFTATTTAYSYDPSTHLLTQITDGVGGVTTFAYADRRLTSVTNADSGVFEVDSVQTRALGSGTTTTNLAPSFRGWTRQARERDAGGGEAVSVLDNFGYPIRTIDANGQTTNYVRNADGLVIKEEGPDPDDFGPLGGLTTYYNYDQNGNLLSQSMPGGRKRTWEGPFVFGRPKSYTDELGTKTEYVYDVKGNLLYSQQIVGALDTGFTYSDTTGQVTGDTDDIFHSYLYTSAADNTLLGLVKKAYDPLDRVTSYAYYNTADQAAHPHTKGLLKQVTLPAVAGVSAIRSFDYDAFGNLDTYTDEENRTTSWTYDALDRVSREILPDPDTGDAIAAPYREFTYDQLNRRTSERDEEGNVTNFAYAYLSGGGQQVTVTEPARDATSQPTVSEYRFDALGNLTKTIDPLDRETTYAYDLARRLEKVTYPDPDQIPGGANGPLKSPVTSYNYDAMGRLLGVVESTDGANLDPELSSGQAPSNEGAAESTWNVTTAVGTSEIDLFPIFKDNQDADSALRYTIVSNTNAALLDSLAISSTYPRKLLLDFQGNAEGEADIVVRATDTAGLSVDHEFQIDRSEAQVVAEFRLNSTTSGSQVAPAVAPTPDGGFVAVWEDTTAGVVRARRFQDSGSTNGAEFVVSQVASATVPSVAVGPDGRLVFTYWRNASGLTRDLYRRTFNADGTAQGNEVLVATYAAAEAAPVRAPLTFLTNGESVIVWRTTVSGNSDIKGQRYSTSDATLGSVFTANSTTTTNQLDPAVAANEDGGFTIVWHGNGPGGDSLGVYARRYLANGGAVGNEALVNQTILGNQFVAALPSGAFVITWYGAGVDALTGLPDGGDGVYARLWGADGTPASGEILVNQTSAANEQRPTVAMLPDGGFVIAWRTNFNDTADVYARRFSANGTPLENQFRVNTTDVSSTQTDPSVAVTTKGAVIVGWRGQGTGDNTGIFGRLLTAYEPGNTLSGPFRALSVVPGETVHGPVTHLLATFSQPLSSSGWNASDFIVSGPTPSISATSATIISGTQVLVTLDKELYAGGTYNVQVTSNVRKGAGTLADRLDQDGDGTPGQATDAYLPSFYLLGGNGLPDAEKAPEPSSSPYYINLDDPTYDNEVPVSVVDLQYEFFDVNEPSSGLTYTVEDVSATGLLDSVQLDGTKLRLYYARGYYSATPTTVTVRATDKTGRSATKAIDVTRYYPLLWVDDYDAKPNRLRVQHISAVGLDLGWFDRFVITFSGPVDSIGAVTVDGPDGAFTMSTTRISNRQYLATTNVKRTTPGSYRVTVETASHVENTTLNQDDDGQRTEHTSLELVEDQFHHSFRLQPGSKPKGRFDQNGFQTQYVDALGNVTTYAYDKAGNVTSVTDPLGHVSRYEYDSLGRLTVARKPYVDPDAYITVDDDFQGSAQFQSTPGAWTWHLLEGYELDNLSTATSTTLTAKAEWTFPVEAGAQYEIVATWPKNVSWATDAPYRAYDGDSTSGTLLATARVNQQQGPSGHGEFGNLWQTVDVVRVNGTVLTVQLGNDAALGNFVRADAVRIIKTSVTEYAYDRAGNVTHVTDANGVTQYDYDERYRLKSVSLPDPSSGLPSAAYKTTYEYDQAGQLKKVIDALGAQTQYLYDGLGRVKSVTQPDPVTGALSATLITSYKHDNVGNLTEIKQPALGAPWGSPVTAYAYDKHYNLVSVTEPDPDGTPADFGSPVTTFTYDDADRLTRMTDPLSRPTDYKYDELDQLIEVKNADPAALGGTNRPVTNYAYDQRGNRTQTTDPLGRTTQYGFDALDRLVTVTNAIGGISATRYDDAGQVSGEIDALGRLTEYAYDPRGNLVQVTLPSPRTASAPQESSDIQYEYDALGNRTKLTDAMANVTTYAYDRQNRLTTLTEPDPDAPGTGDPSPVTSYTYDAVGRMLTLQESHAVGTTRKWKRDYDKLGRLTKLTEPDPSSGDATGAFTSYGYDNLSRLTQVTAPDPDGTGGSEYVSPVTNYGYDALGRHTSTTLPDPDGAGGPLSRPIWFFEYDVAGQLFQTTSPDPNDNPSTLNPAITTTYAHDNLGRLKSETSALGYVTAYAYDLAGNLTKVTKPDPDGTTTTLTSPVSYRQYDALDRLTAAIDEREGITRFTYDGVGNVTSLTDPVLNTTQFAYDRLDRVTSETNQRGDARKYEYDRNSNVTKQIDREGRVRSFTYDHLDRAKTEVWFANVSDATPNRTLTWTYNLADELTGVTDPAATYSYANDKLGHVELVTSEIAGLGASKKVFLRQTYDALGRRKDSLATIGSTEVGGTKDYSNVYKYDGLSRLKRLDQDKRGTGAVYNEVAEKRVDFVYDQIGRFTSIARYKDLDGGATNEVATGGYTYDNGGRLTDLDYKKGATNLTGYNLFYDQLDRLTRMEFTNATYAAETVDYKYDATDQLTTADRSSTANDEAYVHDLNGNRRASGAANSVVDANNRLTNDGTYTYEYDKDGNRTKQTKTSDGSYTTYAYDQRHRLTGVVTRNIGGTVTRQVDYTYDAFDRLVKRVADLDGAGVGAATTEYFAYDGHDVALRFDGAGSLTKRYLNGPVADQVLAEEQLSSGVAVTHVDRTFWALSDYAGTVRDVYNSAGALKNHLTFDTFGNVKSETAASVDFLYGFQGLLRDEATGLYVSQTRWLDPLTGKWLQEDWIGFAGGDANLARFVGNSPTLYADARGTDATSFVHWWNSWTSQPPVAPPTAPGLLPPPPPETNPTRPKGPGVNPGEQPGESPGGKTNPKGPAGGGRPTVPKPNAPKPSVPTPRPGPRVGTNPGAAIGGIVGIGAMCQFHAGMTVEQSVSAMIEQMVKQGQVRPGREEELKSLVMQEIERMGWKNTGTTNQQVWTQLCQLIQGVMKKYPKGANSPAVAPNAGKDGKTSTEPETAGAAGGQGNGGGGKSVATGGEDPNPSFEKAKRDYWKKRAESAELGEFSPENLVRMRQGKPPLHDILRVPKELHHTIPQRVGGPNTPENFQELWPWQHSQIDPFRRYTGPRPPGE